MFMLNLIRRPSIVLNILVLCNVISSKTAQGILCYTCQHTENESCNNQGYRDCNPSEGACMNVIRIHGNRKRIMKTCKQPLACENQVRYNSECRPGASNSVCYSCCSGDLCNWNQDASALSVLRPTPMNKFGNQLLTRPGTRTCPVPSMNGNTYNVIDLAPTGLVARVTVTPNSNSDAGWSSIIIYSSPMYLDATVQSYSAQLSAVSSDRRAYTFINRQYNSDISSRQQYTFTIIITGSNLMSNPSLLTASVGFYENPVVDASCFLNINSNNPKSTTTPTSSTQVSSTSVLSSTTTMVTTATTQTSSQPSTTVAGGVQNGCQEIEYLIDNAGWVEKGIWNFIFRYRSPVGNFNDWAIKLEFSQEVLTMTTYDSNSEGPFMGNQVWLLKPKQWNQQTNNQKLEGIGICATSLNQPAEGKAFLCNNGVIPDISSTVWGATTTSHAMTSSTTMVAVTTRALTPNGPTGMLPNISQPTQINFKKSSPTDLLLSGYDYNELLHKSILFYEAQRSGPLPKNNRILWRGDSGLKDGCYRGTCVVDLTGGWYDAGDFMKFGFPMAFSTTVLAWGMIEFKDAYKDAGEWNNALNMLKWATDYFIKAHVTKNELYVQVGDPTLDHSSWGHPETMTMERPIFKIDPNNPGTEVAAETAAALAASYIVFKDIDAKYADMLLQHSKQLYDFAQYNLGHYHVSLKESKVGNFYRSFSGYDDELMWGGMWLHKATGDVNYYNKVITMAGSLESNSHSFSWDQKSPGVLVLLSQVDSKYRASLRLSVDRVMNLETTPRGMTFFSTWGSNRYAANYALIAILTAKIEGFLSKLGQKYYSYGMEQIYKMLGDGDQSRSYVVGFGVNYPKQPHHRSSSCRAWTINPASRICNWSDRDSASPNPHILYGALVGGPNKDGNYKDDRTDYTSNEVAVDYNAGFQSAIAGLKYFLMQRRQ